MRISEDLAEETGVHIGDGSMNYYANLGCYTVACHKIDDKDFMENHLAPLIERIYRKKLKLRNWSQGTYGFRIHSNEIVDFKHKVLGLPLGKKGEIGLPKIFFSKTSLLIACVRGIFATDGCFYLEQKYGRLYPRLIFTTTSRKLARQIKKLLEIEGMSTSMYKKSWKKGWRPCYDVAVRGFKNLKIWNQRVGFINKKHMVKLEILKLEKYLN